MQLNAAKAGLIDQLLAQCSEGEDFFGPEGVFTKLKGAVMERLLQAELSDHLEQGKELEASEVNSRNGYSDKTVQTETGPVRIRVPRDREGTFEPKVIKKHQRRVEGFDEKVLALYARGMSVRDIQGHLQELYGTEVSPELISEATEAVMLYLSGKVNGVSGFFRSDDEGANFVCINDDAHQYGGSNVIIGDSRVYGRAYIAPGGRGILYGDPK